MENLTPQNPKFYTNNSETWDAMINMCLKAEKSIDLEQYIFSDDFISKRFVEVLQNRARAGVKVRMLCDAVGSWNFYTSPLPEVMRHDGIEIRFVNIVSPWRINNIFSWFFRDHRKILIVDEKIGVTGSTGMRDDMTNWRETNVLVQSEIVGEMLGVFNEMWDRAIDRRRLSRIRKAIKYTRGLQFLTNSPYFRKRFLYHAIIDEIRSAKKYAYITTPYFIPDHKLSRAMRLAARRGVDVRLIVPAREQEKEPFVGTAARSHYEKILKAGVKIFEYKKTFLHAKTIVIDDNWSTVGSFNLDSLSFLYNYEANIVSTNPNVAQDLRNHFIQDLFDAEEIRLDDWLKRPFIQKFREFLVMPIRRFL